MEVAPFRALTQHLWIAVFIKSCKMWK